jgi:hypothetical protein
MRSAIAEAKRKLPLPALLHQLGLGEHAKKSACCPLHEDRRNSFSVYKNAKGEFRFKCFAGCGGGDEINFLELSQHLSRSEATKLFLEMAGVNGARSPESQKESRSTFNWRECVESFTEKHVQKLARWRGYSIDFCRWLRKSDLVGLFNGCIAFPVHDHAGNVVAIHYRLKDRSWRYHPQGARVHPLVIGELVSGDTAYVFESYWDAYAFMDKSGERHGIVITRGASNGALVADVIPQDAKVYLWTQNDAAGAKWQRDICANAKATVKRARIPAAHKDLNDWTCAGAATDDLLAVMVDAEVIEEAAGSDKRQPLTIRTIGEILEMTFDDKELVLTNGYLALGERTAICGMGGVGKSRLIMQLALCCRAGHDFLGWETRRSELLWLFLQTENSCRRLKYDLGRMLTAFEPEEQQAIKAGVFFHTLEADDDGFLMLDAENSERIATAIDTLDAHIVVFDPLRDFGLDDLNADRYMTETLREISRITKRGNPRRIPLIIHHAVTGRAGILKATGFDRSSFGRNSKVLFSWTRAQINVSPGLPDDNSVIVISSAKCSNACEFEPFAAMLDERTMLYQLNEDFDFDAWQHSLESPRTGAEKLNVEAVLDLLPATGGIPKADVIERLRDKGIGERRSRPFIAEHLAPSGPLHEWHIKRPNKRDAIHLSRHPQPDAGS